MRSKTSLIVKNNIQDHINQIIEQNEETQDQLKKIGELIQSRENTLHTLIDGFEELLVEYEKNHAKNLQWHKTLKVAKQYLGRKDL